jgi:hypothetical protein
MFDTISSGDRRGSAEPPEAGVFPSASPSACPEADSPAELPLERLEHEIVQLASHINAGTCRWLELIAEFDRREGWGSWSCRSCVEWVAWRCALDTRSAREHVRVARCLDGLPLIHAAFARGELSYSKVRALTRVAEPGSEGDLLELAEHATAAQLERIVRGLRRATTEDANETHAQRFVSCWWESDGSLSISANLPAEDGAAFERALDAMHDLIRADRPRRLPDQETSAEPASEADSCGSAEPPEPRSATNADALVAMAEAAVAGRGPGSRSGGERYQLVVHVDAATLASGAPDSPAAPGSCRIEDGSALAPETVRRLACDCSIVPMLNGDQGNDGPGAALSVGRRTRSIPPAIARALRARDGTCAFPGCENRRFLDAHHIHHWAQGGETSAENLVRLCRRHHRLLHEGGYSVKRLPDGGTRFSDPRGSPLSHAPSAPEGEIGELVRSARRSGEPGAGETRLKTGTGERLDLDLTLAALLSRAGAAPDSRDQRN